MMGKKKLSEIKAQLEALSLSPGKAAKINTAKPGAKRTVQELEALCAELERLAKKPSKPKARRRAAKR